MQISTSNLSFNLDIISEMREELFSVDKDIFFDELVADRLEEYHNLYFNDFDSELDSLLKFSENMSIKKLGTLIKKTSKIVDSIYLAQISLFKILQGDKK